jgi:hypothetical protein
VLYHGRDVREQARVREMDVLLAYDYCYRRTATSKMPDGKSCWSHFRASWFRVRGIEKGGTWIEELEREYCVKPLKTAAHLPSDRLIIYLQ